MRKQDYITLAGIAIVCIVCSLIPERPIDPDIQVVKGFWGAIIGAAFQAVGTIASNARQNNALNRQKESLNKLKAEDRAEMNSNYIDRADSQAVLREVREQNKGSLASLNTEGVKRGMTDEAKIAAAGQMNKAYADVVSRLGAVGAQYRDRARERLRGLEREEAGLNYNTAMAQAKGIGDAASLASTSVNDIWEAVAAKRNIGK